MIVRLFVIECVAVEAFFFLLLSVKLAHFAALGDSNTLTTENQPTTQRILLFSQPELATSREHNVAEAVTSVRVNNDTSSHLPALLTRAKSSPSFNTSNLEIDLPHNSTENRAIGVILNVERSSITTCNYSCSHNSSLEVENKELVRPFVVNTTPLLMFETFRTSTLERSKSTFLNSPSEEVKEARTGTRKSDPSVTLPVLLMSLINATAVKAPGESNAKGMNLLPLENANATNWSRSEQEEFSISISNKFTSSSDLQNMDDNHYYQRLSSNSDTGSPAETTEESDHDYMPADYEEDNYGIDNVDYPPASSEDQLSELEEERIGDIGSGHRKIYGLDISQPAAAFPAADMEDIMSSWQTMKSNTIWHDNSTALLVFYTWIGTVFVLLIITILSYKYRQGLTRLYWEIRNGYKRERHVTIEEADNLLTHPGL